MTYQKLIGKSSKIMLLWTSYSLFHKVTFNNELDYQTNALYWTPNPSPLACY